MGEFDRIHELKESRGNKPTTADFALKDEDGKTYFEYVVDNQIELDNIYLIEHITNNHDYLKYMIEHEYYPETYYDPDLLLDNSKGTPLIVPLFEKKGEELEKLPLSAIRYLFEEHNGKYIIEELLSINDVRCKRLFERINDFELIFKCLQKINKLEYVKYLNEECLFYPSKYGTPALEEFVKGNVPVEIDKNNPRYAEIYYKCGKYSELLKFDVSILVNYPSTDNNYLNALIEAYKNGQDIKLDMPRYTKDKKAYAEYYLALYRNGIDVSPKASELFDVYDAGKKPSFLFMYEMDPELTKKYVVNEEVLKTFRDYLTRIFKIKDYEIYNAGLDELLKYIPDKNKYVEKLKQGDVKELAPTEIYEDELLTTMIDGMTILEYAIENNIKLNMMLYGSIDVVLANLKLKTGVFGKTEEANLYKKVSGDKLLIDLLFENEYNYFIQQSIENDPRVLDYCVKYNNFEALSQKFVTNMLLSVNGSFEAEKYLNNDKFLVCLKRYPLTQRMMTNMLDKGYLKGLIHTSENNLLMTYKGKTVLEHLLDNNISPSFYGFTFESIKTLHILFKYRKPELMANGQLTLLVSHPNKENNFLKYMIESFRNGVKVPLDEIDFLNASKEESARAYIQMAKANLELLADELKEEALLSEDEEGKSLLYYLVTYDREITITKLLRTDTMKNPKVNAALKVLSKDGLTDFSFRKYNCANLCQSTFNRNYANGEFSPVEDLLEELRGLFANDGKSDMELVDALITSYRYVTRVNPIFIEELKVLIETKKKNPEFHYKRVRDGAYFNPWAQEIVSHRPTISTIVHETGHALHFFTTKEEVPKGYYELLEKIRNSPGWLKKVEDYAKNFQDIREKAHAQAVAIVEKAFKTKLTKTDNDRFEKLLKQEKEKVKKIYLKKGYKEEDLDVILNEAFTKEEITRQKMIVEIREVEDLLLRQLYDAFKSIGDFIDAISSGAYRSRVLKNDNGEVIPPSYGHGVRYYNMQHHKFCEMVANYSEIIKSKHADKVLIVLRNIVGDELVDMLDDFYCHKMLKLPVLQEEYEPQTEQVGISR